MREHKTPWKDEIIRLCGVLVIAWLISYIAGSFACSLLLVLCGYIALFGYKLYEVVKWLQSGMADEATPHSGGLIGCVIDQVFRHKKHLEKSHAEQKAITQQFHETISAIPSATVILSRDNQVEWANYPALTLLGINGQRDIGVPIEGLLRQPYFIEQLNNVGGEQFETSSPIEPSITLAVQVVNYAKKRRLLIAHNITPHIEVQRSRKTFIANASHELRTPLTVIAGYLEFIQSDPTLPDSLSLPVEKAIEQSANMQVLINDLLTLSKLEDKNLHVDDVSRIDVKTHMNSIVQTLIAGGKIKKKQIIAEAENNLFIEASEKELNSVCYNLITNAIKYSEDGSQIHVRWQKLSGDYAAFTVTDKGIGIAPEHISHLTERFYRVDGGRSRRVGGTGLGLSIVKHIVERHNGRIEIHSRLGEGSKFSVILPIQGVLE